MYKLYTLFLLLLALTSFTSAQECQAEASVHRRQGKWENKGLQRRIYTINLRNTGSCSFTGVAVKVSSPTGTFISSSWGLGASTQLIDSFGNLESGQTYQGPGFVFYGEKPPTVTIQSFSGCQCGDSTGLAPSDPGKTSGSITTSTTTGGANTPTGPFRSIGMKFLLLACNSTDVRAAVAKTTFSSVGTPYDQLIANQHLNSTLNLTNPDGSGKYIAIITATEFQNCWTRAQINEMEEYEKAFRIKVVIMYSFPYPANGVQLRPAGGTSLNGAKATFALNFLSSIPFYKPGAEISISGVYSYPSIISNTTIATPAIYGNIGGQQYIFAALINYLDGRRHLEFYFDQGQFALYSILIGASWFQWASNGVFGGLRRIEFNAQIDDIFMATGGFDNVTGAESTTNIFRLTPSDLLSIKNWQSSVNSRLPKGSNFVLTFPYNMATVMQKGGITGDPLYLTAKSMRDEFYWESHTYSHLYLDNLTYQQVKDEWTKNTAAVLDLFDNDLSNPHYSNISVVTPSISGMYNGEALRAMWDVGIRNVVGDNSRPDLIPTDLYHGLYTTAAYNGFAGIYIIPRHATNIYYFASTVEEVEEQFNLRYVNSLGYCTFDEIVQKDVDVATMNLLSYRHDPFMFHQANMRTLMINGKDGSSLLGYWIDSVLDSLLKYTTLPIMSHTHDDLSKMYLAREARDAVGFSAQLQVDIPTNQIVGFTATTTQACKFAVSGAIATEKVGVTNEVYGSEKTIWLDMGANANITVSFNPPVKSL